MIKRYFIRGDTDEDYYTIPQEEWDEILIRKNEVEWCKWEEVKEWLEKAYSAGAIKILDEWILQTFVHPHLQPPKYDFKEFFNKWMEENEN